jgi:hypothetical protein
MVTPHTVIAIDPSLTKPGLAVFQDRLLITAIRVHIPKGHPEDPGARAMYVAREIFAMSYPAVPNRLVYEWPQIYRAARSKGDPNDLIALAAIGSAFAGLWSKDRLLEIQAPTPAQWIGQLPKSETGDPWDSPRGARIKSRLDPIELARVQAKHDAVDAVGLGLWSLGRLERHRVFPGAR